MAIDAFAGTASRFLPEQFLSAAWKDGRWSKASSAGS
ncbi:hypothetical protein ABIF81_000609 [Bradyrhizobium daqingense]